MFITSRASQLRESKINVRHHIINNKILEMKLEKVQYLYYRTRIVIFNNLYLFDFHLGINIYKLNANNFKLTLINLNKMKYYYQLLKLSSYSQIYLLDQA